MDKKTLETHARLRGCFPQTDNAEDRKKAGQMDNSAKVMDSKTLELIAVGASVAACCIPCLEYHVKAAREAGASHAELASAINMAKKVRQTPMDKIDQKCEELGI
jgi:AhpD family alkylhydroperoxidase